MYNEVPDSRIVELARLLEHDEAVVEPTVRRVSTEIPSYVVAAREQLEASVHRNLRLAARAVLTREVPSSEEIWEAEQATLERLSAGLPIEDIMGAFRISSASIEERLVELAEQCRIPSGEIVSMTRLLWQLSDAFSARAASA